MVPHVGFACWAVCMYPPAKLTAVVPTPSDAGSHLRGASTPCTHWWHLELWLRHAEHTYRAEAAMRSVTERNALLDCEMLPRELCPPACSYAATQLRRPHNQKLLAIC